MRWLPILTVCIAATFHASQAHACSCMKLTPSEGFTSSYAVFTGEVTEIDKNEATRFGGLEVTLRVKRMWKGEPSKVLKVHTASTSAACGYGFVEGVTYLVYAVRDEADPMRVSLCSRTAPVEDAKEDLDFLGKPTHTFEGRKRGCSVSGREPSGAPVALLGLVLCVGLVSRRLVWGE